MQKLLISFETTQTYNYLLKTPKRKWENLSGMCLSLLIFKNIVDFATDAFKRVLFVFTFIIGLDIISTIFDSFSFAHEQRHG